MISEQNKILKKNSAGMPKLVWGFTEHFFVRTLENMITRKDIEKLASLARIRLSEEEKGKFPGEINSILGYIEQIQNAPAPSVKTPRKDTVYNVMREDNNPHESGVYTKDIVREFPKKEGNYLKVKNIL